MAKKKPKNQLPSGSIRIQVYDYTDPDGKKHYKSFTAPSKAQARLMAAEWMTQKQEAECPLNMNVYESIERYIELKRAVLSPSTLRGYSGLKKNHFDSSFGRRKLSDLTNADVQRWISDLSLLRSPKTVRNAHALLSAALDVFHPDFRFKTTLPAKKKPELYTPSDQDVRKLIDHIKGTDLEIAVYLAAFGPLRRGEICALTSDDIKGNIVTVSKSMVYGDDNCWHIKQPKTYDSYRTVTVPDFVAEKLKGKTGRIIDRTPDCITRQFGESLKATTLPHFRFHDLRHYFVSIMHANGVPDQYILDRGGWSSDNVMKTVYRNTINLETVRQNKKINNHFTKLTRTIV